MKKRIENQKEAVRQRSKNSRVKQESLAQIYGNNDNTSGSRTRKIATAGGPSNDIN